MDLRSQTENLRREVEILLFKLGFLCRVFGRSKSRESLEKKLSREPGKYEVDKKLIQDLIGIRVVFYFQEDIEIAKNIICNKFSFDPASSTIDNPKTDQFSVTRYNLIFKLPDIFQDEIKKYSRTLPIDCTFELQLRSILSEGWHEVEHDLRYKSNNNWTDQEDLGRALNGIMATLETSEWSMKKIFDDLAYRHYKLQNWSGMLQNKLRMRIDSTLNPKIVEIMNSDNDLAKSIFRMKKNTVIKKIHELETNHGNLIPLKLDNLIYVWNFHFLKNEKLLEITPEITKELLQKSIS